MTREIKDYALEGECPVCGSYEIDYGFIQMESEYHYHECTCKECKTEFREYVDYDFGGQYIINCPTEPELEDTDLEPIPKDLHLVVIFHCNEYKEKSSYRLIGVVSENMLNSKLEEIKKANNYTDEDMDNYIFTESVVLNSI